MRSFIICLSALLAVANARTFKLPNKITKTVGKIVYKTPLKSVLPRRYKSTSQEDDSWPKVLVPNNFELNAVAYLFHEET